MVNRTRPRRWVRVVASLVALVVVIGVAGLPFYVFPATDAEAKTDVIMVIGPPDASRIALAESMIERGLSSNLVVSAPATGYQSIGEQKVCTEKQTFTVICSTPDPFTTQGEARELKKLTAEHHWGSATVITFTPHIFRARIIMERCYAGDLRMVADRSPFPFRFWVYAYAYQTGALIKVALHPGC